MTSILVVAAHPDDIEIGVGGSIAAHVERGDSVTIAIATDGRRSGDATTRRREQEKSATILGVGDIRWLTAMPDDYSQNPATIDELRALVDELEPDILYSHYGNDTHQEHREVYGTCISVGRFTPNVYLYESVTSLPSFSPNMYTPLSRNHFGAKLDALACHQSQLKRWRRGDVSLDRFTEAMSRFRGAQCGTDYAEAFIVYKTGFDHRRV